MCSTYRRYDTAHPRGSVLEKSRLERCTELNLQTTFGPTTVGLWVSPHVFSQTAAAVDTKCGYVGMCNGRSAQQESGAALSMNSMFTAGA